MINDTRNLTHALQSLRPGAEWVLRDMTYAGLEWHDTVQTKPTELEVQTEIQRLQVEWENNEYQRLRAPEYPPVIDQLDTIFHGGLEAWRAQIQAVKDKYPKP